jgi:hypothetical protein
MEITLVKSIHILIKTLKGWTLLQDPKHRVQEEIYGIFATVNFFNFRSQNNLGLDPDLDSDHREAATTFFLCSVRDNF